LQVSASPFGPVSDDDERRLDPDATRKVNAFKLADLAATLPDETSRFPMLDACSLPAALPTPPESFAPTRIGPPPSASAYASLTVAFFAIAVVAAGIAAIALGAQLLR
jgi:hypothetical protein